MTVISRNWPIVEAGCCSPWRSGSACRLPTGTDTCPVGLFPRPWLKQSLSGETQCHHVAKPESSTERARIGADSGSEDLRAGRTTQKRPQKSTRRFLLVFGWLLSYRSLEQDNRNTIKEQFFRRLVSEPWPRNLNKDGETLTSGSAETVMTWCGMSVNTVI